MSDTKKYSLLLPAIGKARCFHVLAANLRLCARRAISTSLSEPITSNLNQGSCLKVMYENILDLPPPFAFCTLRRLGDF